MPTYFTNNKAFRERIGKPQGVPEKQLKATKPHVNSVDRDVIELAKHVIKLEKRLRFVEAQAQKAFADATLMKCAWYGILKLCEELEHDKRTDTQDEEDKQR